MFDGNERVLNIQLFDLLAAVRRAFENLESRENADLLKIEEFPIDKKIEKVLYLLERKPWILVDEVFLGETKKRGVITCFMAVLELLKIGKILARQDGEGLEIRLYMNPDKKDADYHKLMEKEEQTVNGQGAR